MSRYLIASLGFNAILFALVIYQGWDTKAVVHVSSSVTKTAPPELPLPSSSLGGPLKSNQPSHDSDSASLPVALDPFPGLPPKKIWTAETSPLLRGPKAQICVEQELGRETCFQATTEVIGAYKKWNSLCNSQASVARKNELDSVRNTVDGRPVFFDACSDVKQSIDQSLLIERYLDKNTLALVTPDAYKELLSAFLVNENLPADVRNAEIRDITTKLMKLNPEEGSISNEYLTSLLNRSTLGDRSLTTEEHELGEKALAIIAARPNDNSYWELKFRFETQGLSPEQTAQAAEIFSKQHAGSGIAFLHASRSAYDSGDIATSKALLDRASQLEPQNLQYQLAKNLIDLGAGPDFIFATHVPELPFIPAQEP